ncbi:MAG: hypothetical protein WCD81_04705 [Candidatus Bathyarchaeia archaeon]
MLKTLKLFRLDLGLYGGFKDLASRIGYTVTGAFEKFVFPRWARLTFGFF